MAARTQIAEYLEGHGIDYEWLKHEPAMTAADEAASVGIDAHEVAKVLVVHGRRGRALVAIPASSVVDMHALREELGDPQVHLATEAEMEEQFPGFELGSVPPIEEVAGAPVYVDRHLLDRDDVVFAAGTHTESVKVRASALQLLGRHASVEVCRAPRERPVDLGMR